MHKKFKAKKFYSLFLLITLLIHFPTAFAFFWVAPIVKNAPLVWSRPGELTVNVLNPLRFDNEGNIFYSWGFTNLMKKFSLSTYIETDLSYNLSDYTTYSFINKAFNQQGNIYAAIAYQNSAYSLYELLPGVTQWNEITTLPNGFQTKFVTVDSNNNLIAGSASDHKIYKLPSGSSKWLNISLPSEYKSLYYGGFFGNRGLYSDKNGNVFAMAIPKQGQYNDVLKLPVGETKWVVIAKNLSVANIAFDNYNNLYMLTWNGGHIYKVPASNSIPSDLIDLTYNLQAISSGGSLESIAVDAYGDIFVGGIIDHIAYLFELPAGSTSWAATNYTKSATPKLGFGILCVDNEGLNLYASDSGTG